MVSCSITYTAAAAGEPILLLAGFRDNAHVFDDFAPRFTDRFRVLGLTRRGFGESETPAGGYDTDTRVEDVRQFLDAKRIGTASLIGHSMAGEEMTAFAARYPERTEKLVYLDAAFDRTPEAWLAGHRSDDAGVLPSEYTLQYG